MSKYDDLLREAKANAEAFALTAREYIPKMYSALRTEDPSITPDEARDRIQKDCKGIWSRRTIPNALPDEAKDAKKQKAGRMSRMEHRSAAVFAAPQMQAKQMKISTDGKCIVTDQSQSNMYSQSTIGDKIRYIKRPQDHDNMVFEFSIPRGDVMEQLIDDLAEEDNKDTPLWFSGVIDIHSGKVVNVNIGRRTKFERSTSYDDNQKQH